MAKEKNVVNFYVTCNKLKNVIRKGWRDWNVQAERRESVAEHIYSTQMLAIAMWHEFEYDIDLMKVIYMLAIHEVGEIVIGDLTQFDINKQEKEKLEHDAAKKVLGALLNSEEIEKLFLEFDAHETKESKFAYMCDKLECDLQCRVYDEQGLVDLNNQDRNLVMKNPVVAKLIDTGASWSEMWLKFGQQKYPYDDNFRAVSNYAINNKIYKNNDKNENEL